MAQDNYVLNRLLEIHQTNFEVSDVKDYEHKIVFYIKHRKDPEYLCQHCGSVNTSCHSKKWITLKDMSWGSKKVVWMVERALILCSCSYNMRVEKLTFRSKHHFLTQRFEEHIEKLLCTHMFTVADVSKMLGLDYGIIYKIDHDVLMRLIQHMQIPDPVNISVDEKSFKKGHNYVTIVTDTDLGKVIWVSVGNKKDSLDEFFITLGPERCKKIKTVSKDLHRPYAASCDEHIPQALQVADPFHVVQRLNKSIDESRKELLGSAEVNKTRKAKIKSSIWVLRHKQENMGKKLYKKLDGLKKVNEPLYDAYLLKESFFEFFLFKPFEVAAAKRFLEAWCEDAEKTIFTAFKDFSDYIKRHTEVLLNIIRERRSSAISEGINRKVTVIKSMAYGYRSVHYFMLKILQRCGVLGQYWVPESKMADYIP